MRTLFVHQNFPGQFIHLVRHLLADGRHEIVFITEDNANVIPGVRKVTYRLPPPRPDAPTNSPALELDTAFVRAAAVADIAHKLKALGFYPDIVIGHQGWGEMLDLVDVWPGVPTLGYYEFFYRTDGLDVGFDPEFPLPLAAHSRVRAKNAINLLALANPGWGQTPTRFQHRTYPDWAQRRIAILPEGVDLDRCRPDPARAQAELHINQLHVAQLRIAPGDTLLTYVARDLEPYRGFHILMRAIPALLAARPDLKIVIVGGDGVSYGARLAGTTWREFMLAQIGPLDPARVAFPGKIDYASYLALLQRSTVHAYLTYPFVASWSLREAIACGCAIVASDTAPVREFLEHDATALLTPFLDPAALADAILTLLADRPRRTRLATAARAYAERHLRLDTYLAHYLDLIAKVRATPTFHSPNS